MFYHPCHEKKLQKKTETHIAREIYAQMISSGCELDSFVASDGWLKRFMERNKLVLGHTNLILCCSGQKTFQAGSVGRLNNGNDSRVISGCHMCVSEDRTRVLVSSVKVLSPARNAFVSSAKNVTKRIRR